jgi:hypothetical protein
VSRALFDPDCLCLRRPHLRNRQPKYSIINQGYLPSCLSLVVLDSRETRVVPEETTLEDDPAAVPDVAEDEDKELRKGAEVDPRGAVALRGLSSVPGERT